MKYHTWVVRTKCVCGYIWTTPGSPSVVCICVATEILDNIVIRGGADVMNEDEFKQAVADDINVIFDELALVQG